MTLRSQKLTVLDRLRRRFDLEPADYAAGILLDPTIRLFTQVDELLKESRGESFTPVAVTANGNYPVKTVPEGKRIHLLITAPYRVGGNFDLAYDYVYDASRGVTLATYSYTPAASHSQYYNPTITLEEGDMIGINVANFVGNGDIDGEIWYTEEDAY